ncbi:MAG: alpha/beta hydrolase [Anaerolineae bacterium]|nr:alpha/beta hydrolase [Anaerolineae bacterium]
MKRYLSKNNRVLFIGILIIAAGIVYGLFAFPIVGEQIVCGEHGNDGIDFKGYVTIGGIPQWVTVKGNDCSNPVVLMVHGGPGNPSSLYSDSQYIGWEDDFILVHWDQRGSGKTFEANQEIGEVTEEMLNATELSIDLLVKDGLEVANLISRKLKKERIVLTGTSWGSVIAVKMAARSPEKFYFYVGVSQLVNYDRNLADSYHSVLSIAKEKGDQAAVSQLEEIGEPPWTNPRNFGVMRRIISTYENAASDALPELKRGSEYDTYEARTAYATGEEFSFVKFVGLQGDGMAQTIELDVNHTEFEIPIIFIQGESDLLTMPHITLAYFDAISAPEKEYVLVERSAHNPTKNMLARQKEIILKYLANSGIGNP